MATHFSQNKYIQDKEKKNEPLSRIDSPLKKLKNGGSSGIFISNLVHTLFPFSSAVSIDEFPFSSSDLEKEGEERWECLDWSCDGLWMDAECHLWGQV